MDEYIKKEDVLKIIYDIKENKDIPKNYGTLLDIIQQIRNLPAEKVVNESMIIDAEIEAYKDALNILHNNLHNAYDECFETGSYKQSFRDVIDSVFKRKNR